MFRCLLLGAVLLVWLSEACPYHRMLERLQRQQREREREFRRRYGMFQERSPPVVIPSPASPQLDPSVPHINLTPDASTSVSSSRQEYYVVSNPKQPEETTYRAPSYRPQPASSACPNTNFYCPSDTVCVYDTGRYLCRRMVAPSGGCGVGTKRVNISQYQYRCEDMDECADNSTNDCDHNCRNYFGGYQCTCNFGYMMNNKVCEDVNECTSRQHQCQHECVNTEGGYTCECPDGYENVLNNYCKDVDECDDDVCGAGEECLNLFGGYECNTPGDCEEGYHRANSTSGSKPGICVIDKFVDPNVPVSISENRFALQRNYPAYREVGRLRYTQRRSHQYYVSVVEGRNYFQAYQSGSYISIRTMRQLSTPGPLSMKIEITDYGYDPVSYRRYSTKSRVDITFVISQYSF